MGGWRVLPKLVPSKSGLVVGGVSSTELVQPWSWSVDGSVLLLTTEAEVEVGEEEDGKERP